jgi:hypothetical protein
MANGAMNEAKHRELTTKAINLMMRVAEYRPAVIVTEAIRNMAVYREHYCTAVAKKRKGGTHGTR